MTLAVAVRCVSGVVPTGGGKEWDDFWSKVEYPSKKEQRIHDGLRQPVGMISKREQAQKFGARLSGGRLMEGSYIPRGQEWEFADGTPAPASRRDFGVQRNIDATIAQAVRAGARAEELAETGRLPRIPGSKEQRAWDPNIPLFLDDVDEHGAMPANASVSGDPEDLRPVSLPGFDGSQAPYNPSEFIDEPVRNNPVRPFWNRRLWALTTDFLIRKEKTPLDVSQEE